MNPSLSRRCLGPSGNVNYSQILLMTSPPQRELTMIFASILSDLRIPQRIESAKGYTHPRKLHHSKTGSV